MRILVGLCTVSLFGWSLGLHAVDFSEKEHAFIKQNPIISIAMMPNFPPFTYQKNGIGIGFEHDLLALLFEKTGLKFEKHYGVWSKTLNNFKTQQTVLILTS
jgi:polar amino acid transport system substrate-binding protein